MKNKKYNIQIFTAHKGNGYKYRSEVTGGRGPTIFLRENLNYLINFMSRNLRISKKIMKKQYKG